MTTILTCHDGSVAHLMSAKQLISIPTWKGNRIIDLVHAGKIYSDIGDPRRLDSSVFRIVKYMEVTASGERIEQRYIIDGQHRIWCIRKFFEESICEADFYVIVYEKTVEDETEAIEYFNNLNNVKTQHWDQDPALLANAYITALQKQFRKGNMIRAVTTKRPYLSADKLREALIACSDLMRPGAQHVEKFVNAVVAWNTKEVGTYNTRLLAPVQREKSIMESCLEKKFALAFDGRLKWVRECLLA